VTDTDVRLTALADACVRCGLCLPHCPTYRFDRVEGEGPRGRIRLAQGLAEGPLDASDPADWRGLDHCLGCRRCEAVCPAGVQYGRLLVEARRLQRARLPADRRQRLLEWLVRRPSRIGAALRVLGWLRPWLPRGLRRRVPPVPATATLARYHPALGPPRGTVGLFLGCVARRLDAPVHRAAIRVLTGLGWNVAVAPEQGCCGALHRHGGADDADQALARANAAAFADRGLDAVLVSSSGCFDSLREALREAPPVHELLAFVAADERLSALPLRPRPGTVAVHVPCTQAAVVRAPAAARELLQRIPGLQVAAVDGLGCCGAAGAHAVLQRERADALRAPLLDEIAASGATSACTGNIGCRLHLAAGLADAGCTMAVRHPIELLAEALP
jgi:glycolate oxidase iron-sulfur subunit